MSDKPSKSSASSADTDSVSRMKPIYASIFCEPRACPFCISKHFQCAELGIRPCHQCIRHGMEEQCIADAAILKLVCWPCKKAKKNCDKNRPCQRCSRLGMECIPFTPLVAASGNSTDQKSQDPVEQIALRQPKPKIKRTKRSTEAETSSTAEIAALTFSATDSHELRVQEDVNEVFQSSKKLRVEIVEQDNWVLDHESQAYLDIARQVAHDASPMQIYDALSSSQRDLQLYYSCFCDVLSQKGANQFLEELRTAVIDTFPWVEKQFQSEFTQKLSNLAKLTPQRLSQDSIDPKMLEITAVLEKQLMGHWYGIFPLDNSIWRTPGVLVKVIDSFSGNSRMLYNHQAVQFFGISQRHLNIPPLEVKRQDPDRTTSDIFYSLTEEAKKVSMMIHLAEKAREQYFESLLRAFFEQRDQKIVRMAFKDASGFLVSCASLMKLMIAPESDRRYHMVFLLWVPVLEIED